MMAFGQIVLPIAALIAVGLLFVGVKLFFLTPPNRAGVEVIANAGNSGGASPAQANIADPPSVETAAPKTEAKPEVKKPQPAKPQPAQQKVALAGPVDPTKSTKPARSESRPAAARPTTAKPAAAKPAAQAAAKPAATKPAAQPTAAKPAAASQTAAKPPLPDAGQWGVQIGAFTKEEGARTISEQAKKDGYATTVNASDSASGTKFYRVRVTAGDTREKAEKLAAELAAKNYPVQVLQLP